MNFAHWSTITGLLLISMALSTTVLKRLPLSSSIVYLLVGLAVSPAVLDLAHGTLREHARLIERITEIVVLVSLFTSGLKLSSPVGDWRWSLPVRLATTSMIVTVALITLAGVVLLKLPLGAAVLLGGILAPTDPVLASDVQVGEPGDRDRLRFALTGEGGLNDGTAFPVVLLGMGLMGLHDLGEWGWRWFAYDVAWSVGAGLAVGAAIGSAIGVLVLFLRKEHKEAVGLDNFIALGIIALTYGLALEIDAYGFLAVFAAGFAFRRLERRQSLQVSGGAAEAAIDSEDDDAAAGTDIEPSIDEPVRIDKGAIEAMATHKEKAGAYMAHAVLSFNEQVERIGEVAAVVTLGALLWAVDWRFAPWWFAVIVIVVIRPVAVEIGLVGSKTSRLQRGLMDWFGIKGIGSLYYLAYAINHGLPAPLADSLAALTLSVVVASIFVHGVSVTPLMALYSRRRHPGHPL